MKIDSYPKLWAIGTRHILSILEDDVVVQEKVDGCFAYSTPVLLANGKTMTIGKIVNQRIPVEVMSYNEETKTVEISKVTNWFDHGITEDWRRIYVEAWHGKPMLLNCTPNHRIHTPQGWKEAGDINVGDEVSYRDMRVPFAAQQALLGIMLGDGYITSGRLSYSHSIEQEELVRVMSSILSGIKTRFDERVSGYGSNMLRVHTQTSPVIAEIGKLCSCDNDIDGRGKIVSKEWLDQITPIALAWWFMDDGSSSVGKASTQRGKVTLHTERYSDSEIELILDMFKVRFGLTPHKQRYKEKYTCLCFDTEESEKFLCLIAPYILRSAQYKLPEELRTDYCYWDYYDKQITPVLKTRKVVSVSDIPPAMSKHKFDIEVEGNHNFFVNNVLVHNSQFAWMKVDGELSCRSKGQQIVLDAPQKMFARAVSYLQSIIDRIPENIVFRGEWLDKPKHNVLAYDRTPKNGLMLFDAEFIGVEPPFADSSQLAELARLMDIECVPIIYEGKIESSSRFLDLLDRVSVLGGQKIEGVVVKNYNKPYMLADQYQPFMGGKFVSEKFKEVAANTWGKEHTAKGGFDAFKESFCCEARFHKAIQHLKEAGMLDNSPKDIGPLIKEVQKDITEEEKENIKDRLWELFGKDILRTAVRGLPEKYKEHLVSESIGG